MSATLQQLFDKRSTILKDISEKRAEFTGTTVLNLQNEVNNLINLQDTYLKDYRKTQASILDATNLDSIQQIQNELTYLCVKMTDIAKIINNDKEKIKSIEDELKNKTENEKNAEINALMDELNKTENDIKDEMQKENISNFGNYSLVWINQPFGLFVMICKPCMIQDIMKSLFLVLQDKMSEEDFNKTIADISNPENPGLASLISCFIDLLLKAAGNFAIYFFAIKYTVDLLAGMDLGTIMSEAIKILSEVLKDINVLLSDAPKYMLKNLLGPLFDINIPIPAFNFDLSSIAPFLPFNLPMPKIDPYNLFGKLTPFNKDAAASCLPIPLNWKELFFDEAKQKEQEEQDKINEKHQDDITSIANQIQEKKDTLSGVNITRLENNINIFNSQLQILNRQLNSEKRNFNENKNKMSDQGLKDSYQRMEDLCKQISDLQTNIDLNTLTLSQKKTEFENLDVAKINREIDLLNNQKTKLEDNPPIPVKSLAKRAMVVNIENDYGLNDIKDRLNNLSIQGLNIFSDEMLRALQEIGYNLKDEEYLIKIEKLKTYGIDMKNIGQISALAFIGFTLNDFTSTVSTSFSFQNNLDKLQSYKIKVNNPELLSNLGKLGFNLNSLDSLDILKSLYDNGLPIYDISYLKTLFLLGFNFNLKDGVNKLLYLRDYADITSPKSLDNLLKRNVNLNNPNYKYILKEYKQIGLNFNDSNFFENEQWIYNNVKVTDINTIFNILEFYKKNPGTGYNNNQFGYNYEILFFKDEWNTFFNVAKDAIPFGKNDPKSFLKWKNLPTNNPPLTQTIENYGIVLKIDKFMEKSIPLGKLLYKDDGYIYYPQKHTLPGEPDLRLINYPTYNYDIYMSWYNSMLRQADYYTPLQCKGDNVTEAKRKDTKRINGYYNKPEKISVNRDPNYTGPYFTKEVYTDTLGLPDGYHWEKFNVMSILTMNSFLNQWSIKLSITLTITSLSSANNIFYVDVIDTNSKYETQLQSLKKFVEDHGWKINGIPIAEVMNSDDLARIALLYGLTITANINDTGLNKIIDVQEKNSLGNIDKLGLNVRDANYVSKITQLKEKINYSIQSSYYDTSNPNVIKTIVIKKDRYWSGTEWLWTEGTEVNGKIDPDYFTDSNVKLEYKKIILDQQKAELKDVINVSLLSRFGFNFSKDNYFATLTQLSGWRLDLTKRSNEQDIKSLLQLGFHFNQDDISNKIDGLNKIHFSFNIEMLSNKLNALSAMGFHFGKKQSPKMLQMLGNRGLYLDNKVTLQTPTGNLIVDQFETQLSQLNNFGINFNDKQWENKLIKFGMFNINFSSKDWRDQMDNLNLLGINFKDDDWEKKLDNLANLKKLGLDPTNITLKKKLAVLNNMGVDFSKPEDEYSQKVEALILLGAINITEDNANEKRHFEENKKKQLEEIDNQILSLNDELTGNDLVKMKEKLTMLKYQRRLYLVNYVPPTIYPAGEGESLDKVVLPLNPEAPYDTSVNFYDSGIDVVYVQTVDELGYIYCGLDDDTLPNTLDWDVICIID